MGDHMLTYTTDRGDVKLSPGIVRKYLVSGQADLVTDQEVIMFMQLCRYQGLNPFLREAYLIKYSQNSPATMVTGKDTFTKRAAGIKECKGWNAGVIVQAEKRVERRKGAAVFEGEALIGGWADVFRDGWVEPLHNEVSLAEYQKLRDGRPVGSWSSMPATMIRKVALVQGLREAFPDHYQGMYDSAEMGGVPLPETPVQQPEKVVETKEDSTEVDAAANAGWEEGKPA